MGNEAHRFCRLTYRGLPALSLPTEVPVAVDKKAVIKKNTQRDSLNDQIFTDNTNYNYR
jgi:hypothetical protein